MSKRLLYISVIAITLLFCTLHSAAQMSMPDNVCVGSTKTYQVNDPSVPSTYTWTINGVTQTSDSSKLIVTWNLVGTYLITVLEHSADGCDGDLKQGYVYVHPPDSTHIDSTICSSGLPFTWNGKQINAAGDFSAVFQNIWGCDSVVTLTLVVNPNVTGDTTATICQNQLPYTWYENTLPAAGTAKHTFVSASGCDSVVTLTLVVNPNVTGDTTATICQNQLPYTWYENTLPAAGTAKHTFVSASGCDSVVTLTLVVNPNVTGDTTATICQNQLPYTWYENTLPAAGTAKHTFVSASGCDSVVTLTLVVNPNVTGDTTATICQNQLPYTWYENTLPAAGTAKHTFVSASGCDSVVTLTLVVNPNVTGDTTATICQNQLPYTWYENTLP